MVLSAKASASKAEDATVSATTGEDATPTAGEGTSTGAGAHGNATTQV